MPVISNTGRAPRARIAAQQVAHRDVPYCANNACSCPHCAQPGACQTRREARAQSSRYMTVDRGSWPRRTLRRWTSEVGVSREFSASPRAAPDLRTRGMWRACAQAHREVLQHQVLLDRSCASRAFAQPGAPRAARPIPMLRQLRFDFPPNGFDPEAQLNELCLAREDVPARDVPSHRLTRRNPGWRASPGGLRRIGVACRTRSSTTPLKLAPHCHHRPSQLSRCCATVHLT